MGRIVVCGGGVVGAATAMMLADDGHEVVVLEADEQAPPAVAAQAWDDWTRAGVAQFRQAHVLLVRARQVLDAELPGTTRRLTDAGCFELDVLTSAPAALGVAPDPSMRMVTGRRPVLEAVIGAAAAERPRVEVRRGVRVTGLLTGPDAIPGVPHVEGVRTETGEELHADLVVDATGRKAAGARWLAELGAAPVTESADGGFVYYTRFYGGEMPRRQGAALNPIGSFSLLTLEGDNDTWSVTVYGLTADRPLREVRHAGTFEKVLRACPRQAHWLDGTPITPVLAMAGVVDRRHRYVRAGVPVVTGLAAVGDAWACTNPSAGRGLSMGLVHAQALREVTRRALGNPALFAVAWDEATERSAAPFYESQLLVDGLRHGQMLAEIAGDPAPPLPPGPARLATAARTDAETFVAALEVINCVSTAPDVMTRPAVAAAVAAAPAIPPRAPGPDRAELLDLLGA